MTYTIVIEFGPNVMYALSVGAAMIIVGVVWTVLMK